MSSRLIFSFVLFVFIAVMPATGAFSAEVIHRFDTVTQIAKDGTLTVTETINVTAEGKNIKRGIYRDFPILFEDRDGTRREVDFELISVKRDGKPEPHFTEKYTRYVRIYIGDANVFLDPGPYTYEITYQSGRQIRFFDEHDELYWNVTGNGWIFPMQNVTARVELPEGVPATDTVAFTGGYGSTEQAARVESSNNGNRLLFSATRVLAAGEGLTIAVKMPKGSIDPPTAAQKANWFWRDNLNNIIALGVLVIVSAYYFLNWLRIGRDPPSGVIVPSWKAPDGVSPAMMNYIDQKGLAGKGWDAISSAILNLAVKDRVVLEQKTKHLHITSTGRGSTNPLPVGEAAILNRVEAGADKVLIVSKSHGSRIKGLQSAFTSAMESEHRGRFYEHNRSATIVGVLLSIAGIVFLFFFGNLNEETIAAFMIGGFMSIFLSIFLISFGVRFSLRGGLPSKIGTVIGFGIFSFVLGSTVFPALPFLFDFFGAQPILFTSVIGIIVLNILFYFLLGAPTRLGRHLMDEIEGLRTYLELAEKDRMNLAGAPDFSVQHYEELLPYAVALGVEKPWSKHFEKWLAAAVAAGTVAASYQPGWYRGRDFSPDTISDNMGSLSDSIQNSFSSAMPAPKSSSSGFSGSSGGGGFSGGGGGGGGGGGW